MEEQLTHRTRNARERKTYPKADWLAAGHFRRQSAIDLIIIVIIIYKNI